MDELKHHFQTMTMPELLDLYQQLCTYPAAYPWFDKGRVGVGILEHRIHLPLSPRSAGIADWDYFGDRKVHLERRLTRDQIIELRDLFYGWVFKNQVYVYRLPTYEEKGR